MQSPSIPQAQQLQEKASQLPLIQRELQDVQSQVQQLEGAVLQLSHLRGRVADLQAEVRGVSLRLPKKTSWSVAQLVCCEW